MVFLEREERWSFFSRGVEAGGFEEVDCGSRVDHSSAGKNLRTVLLSFVKSSR